MKILTTYPIPEIKKWQESTTLFDRHPKRLRHLRGALKIFKIKDLWLPFKLLLSRKHYDILFTGTEREDVLFAFLQSILPGRKIPHIMIDCLWKKESNQAKKRLKHFLLPIVAKSVTRFVVWSTEQINYYYQEFSIPKSKITFLPFHSTLHFYKVNIKNGDYIFAGGESSRDYPTLINAVRDLPIKLVIALNDSSLILGIDIPHNVIITSLSEEDYLKCIAGSRVVIVPMHAGIIQGAGQQTYLNAMTFKKPVIVSNVTGVHDYLEDHKTAIIVKPEDVQELRTAIKFVLNEKEKVKAIAERGYKLATEHYTVGNFVERSLQLIEQIAQENIRPKQKKSSPGKRKGLGLTNPIKRISKNAIFAFLYYSGLLHIYIKSVQKKQKDFPAVIVNYHSFVDSSDKTLDKEPTIRHLISEFEKELTFMKRHFDIISLDEVVDNLEKAGRFARPTIAITIDDGYKNNFDILFPILTKNKVKATIFLSSGLIGTSEKIWIDKIEYLLQVTEKGYLHTNGLLKEGRLKLDSLKAKRRAFSKIISKMKDMQLRERDRHLANLESQLQVSYESNPTMLNWEQIGLMRKAGITFGAHTCTHPILTNMPLKEAKREIAESKTIIEAKLGETVKHFAYPNGRPQDFNDKLRTFCQEIGFASISTCDFGNNSHASDVWALKRIGSCASISTFAVNLVRSFGMKTKYKIPAVVLGMSINGLGVVRSLARNGIKVYAMDSYKDRPGMSTHFAQCFVCPDVQGRPDEFKRYILDFVKTIGGEALLFPTGDAYNEFVNNNRDALRPNFKFAMPAKAVMDQLLDKKGQYLLAKKLAIPIPQSYFPQDLEQVQRLAAELKYPVALKGVSTGKWRKKYGDKKAIIANNAKELLGAHKNIHDIDNIEPIIQEIVSGPDTHHYKICAYLDRKANPLLNFTLQKIRQYPCDFGVGSSVISVREPKVAELGLKFMKALGYWGVGSIEFKKDAKDGQFKMIEINPRLWAQNSLPDACGQNFALTAYLDILGERIRPKTSFKEGIKWIAFSEDRASFKGYKAQGRMSWRYWLQSVITGQRVWATWAWDDPMPFLKSIKFGFLPFAKIFSRFKRKSAKPEELNGISLEITKDFDSFLKLRQEWNTLLEKSNLNNPFLHHEWLSAWWKGYGQDKKLFIVRFKRHNTTIGFAPLMEYKTQLTGIPISAIGFISNHWTSMDFILSEKSKNCIERLTDLIMSKKTTFILAQMDAESENFSYLKAILKKKKILSSETHKQNACIPIEGKWEDYLKNQSHNFRADFNKKLKRLKKIGAVSFNQDTGKNMEIINQLRAVAQKSWQAKDNVNIINNGEGERFYSEIIKELGDKNILDFSILQLDNKPISYIVGIKNNGSYFAFDTAYNKDFQKYSPGTLIHNLLLERLFESSIKRFDFGYIADYKKRWTEQLSMMIDVTIFPHTILGSILYLTNKIKIINKNTNIKQNENV